MHLFFSHEEWDGKKRKQLGLTAGNKANKIWIPTQNIIHNTKDIMCWIENSVVLVNKLCCLMQNQANCSSYFHSVLGWAKLTSSWIKLQPMSIFSHAHFAITIISPDSCQITSIWGSIKLHSFTHQELCPLVESKFLSFEPARLILSLYDIVTKAAGLCIIITCKHDCGQSFWHHQQFPLWNHMQSKLASSS